MYIGGAWVQASDGTSLESIDPATEEVIGSIALGGVAEVDAAVAAAKAAAKEWRATGWQERAKLLGKLADRIDEHKEELARLDTADCGAPIRGMRADVASASKELRYFGGLGGEVKGEVLPPEPNRFSHTQLEPYGVVGRIVPFNHPFKFAAGKSAAPLMAGNTLVLKPSEETSLSALMLAELADGILPPGVLNVITGLGSVAGAALVGHPDVGRIAFTGGVETGRAILRAAADGIKNVTLELGGKNPMVVFPDVDIKAAAKGAVGAMNLKRSAGQSCQSSSRIFVHASIRDDFLAAFVAEVEALRVGDPQDEDVDLGPVAYRRHYERIMSYLEGAQGEGATLCTGGGRTPGRDVGFYVQPTVFADVTMDMRVARDEIFGPVVSVLDWEDYDQMIEACNQLDFGLTANIWTNDLSAAHDTASRLEAGLVWINGSGGRPQGTPFGGFKHSGLGKDGCLEELTSFARSKAIVTTITPLS